jgi:hypothetical protein
MNHCSFHAKTEDLDPERTACSTLRPALSLQLFVSGEHSLQFSKENKWPTGTVVSEEEKGVVTVGMNGGDI